MTPRKSFIAVLNCEPLHGHVQHFELQFFLTMEAFGRVRSAHRHYHHWAQMTERERDFHRKEVADLRVKTCNRFGLSGTIFRSLGGWSDDNTRLSSEYVRELSDMDHFTSIHADAPYSLSNGDEMMDSVMRLAERPQEMKDQVQRRVDYAIDRAKQIKKRGVLDGELVPSRARGRPADPGQRAAGTKCPMLRTRSRRLEAFHPEAAPQADDQGFEPLHDGQEVDTNSLSISIKWQH